MTGMLASVNGLDEARLILNTCVEIIDLKQPDLGALGALSTKTVTEIVHEVNCKKPVSATVGDLPMQPELIFNAVTVMANTGVDYIKIGFFPGGNWQGTLSKLAEVTEQGNQLIAVLFADTEPDINIIDTLKTTGFTGVMLDTMDKSKGSLSQVMPHSKIKDFVFKAKKAELLCGLAGSLKQHDIPRLISLDANYLGFRGALCEKNNRTAGLNKNAVNSILYHFASETGLEKCNPLNL